MGGKIPVASNNFDGLLSKRHAIESLDLYGKKAVLIHATTTTDYSKFYFRCHVTKEAGFGSGDCSFYVTGTNRGKLQSGICMCQLVAGVFNKGHKLFFKKGEDNTLYLYLVATIDTFKYYGFVKENIDGLSVTPVQTLDNIDIQSLTEVTMV